MYVSTLSNTVKKFIYQIMLTSAIYYLFCSLIMFLWRWTDASSKRVRKYVLCYLSSMVDLLLFMIYCCQDENGKLAYMDFSMVHKNLHLTQVIKSVLYGLFLSVNSFVFHHFCTDKECFIWTLFVSKFFRFSSFLYG